MATHSSVLAWRIRTDRGAWWATAHRVTESDTIEVTLHAFDYFIDGMIVPTEGTF